MKITRIETQRISIPFENDGPRVGLRPSLDSKPWTNMECLLVRVETDDGLVGWGEGFGHFVNGGTEAILATLVGPWFLGKDPRTIVAHMDEAQRGFHGFGRSGPVLYALSAIDLALWDLAAKRAGQPLYRLLGGKDGKLDCYASLTRYRGDPEALRRNCTRARKVGFTMIKLHETTIPAFLVAREALDPDTRVMLDVNCPWSVSEAKAVARAIRDRNFHWLEEPVWPPEDYAGLAEVRKEGVAIACGENVTSLHEFRRLFEQQAVDVVQPSVIKLGGITAMTRVLALAQAFSVRVVPHCFYWGPGYLATAHLAASMAERPPVETPFIRLERSPHALFNPDRATLELPDKPGLGFEPDPAVLDAYRVSRHEIA
ncbi:MAG TPA: mandelate racemase/muconate lactonizing enzyme family protein [Alphaproteobacteria bacterium]